MEFIIDKEKIFKALQSVQSIVDKKNTMPILSNVMLECEEEILSLFATDLEVSLKRSIAIGTKETGRTTVSARKLFEMVRELPEKEIQVNCDEDNNVTIKCGSILFKLKGLPHEEFPSFPIYDPEAFVEIDSTVLKEMIDKTVHSISPEDIQYNLSGIYVEKVMEESTFVRFVATDGHRLSLIDREFELGFLSGEGIIIPRKGIHEIKRVIQDVEGKIEIASNNNQVIVKCDDIVLFVRLVDGVFPKYREVIPEAHPKRILLNRLAFLESLRRASIVSMEKFRGVKFDLMNDTLMISSNNPDIGESEERLNIDYKDEMLSMAFNARYFTEVLASLSCENVLLELNDESSPAIVKDENDERFLAVVMPMRV